MHLCGGLDNTVKTKWVKYGEKTKRDKETTAYGLLPQSLSAVTPRLSLSAKLK